LQTFFVVLLKKDLSLLKCHIMSPFRRGKSGKVISLIIYIFKTLQQRVKARTFVLEWTRKQRSVHPGGLNIPLMVFITRGIASDPGRHYCHLEAAAGSVLKLE